MNTYLPALSQSLIFYLILSLSFFGWGWVLTFLLRIKQPSGHSAVSFIWLGWAFALLIFQILHFFFAVTAYVSVPIFVIGVLFSYKQVRKAIHIEPLKLSTALKFVGVFFGMMVVVVWIAMRSMLEPTNWDSGLYHFNSVRWTNSYPIVLGLGNLHSRLAFNQSFFVYVASLNLYPYFGQGRSIANSFLFLLTFATFIGYLLPVFKQPLAFVQSHPFKFLPSLFSIPFLGYLAFDSNGLGSPTPDLTSTLLLVAMFVILTHGLAEWLDGQRDLNHTALLLTILAVTSVTVKLSNAAFAAVILLFVIAYTWQTSPKPFREVFRILLPAGIILLVYALRGFLLSGAPLYPSTIGYVPMEWAIPKGQVADMPYIIYSWARYPDNYDMDEVLSNWNWLKPWIARNFKNVMDVSYFYPFLLSVFFCGPIVILFLFKRAARPRLLEWAIVLPVIFALLYWFFTAPDIRFVNGLFFLMALCTILVLLTSIHKVVNVRIFAALLCLVFVIGNLHFVWFAYGHKKTIKMISFSGYQAVRELPLDKKETQSGLTIYIPHTGYQCWDAPLPCAPEFKPSLTLREPGNLASGFMRNLEYEMPYLIINRHGN